MTATILLLVLLLLVAVLVGGYVLWPLLRRPAADEADVDVAAVSRSVLRERRRELEASLAHLPADAPERRAALAEFALQADDELAGVAGGDATDATAAPPRAAPRRPWTAALLGALLVLPTFGLYILAGAPEAASPEFRAALREPASIDELVLDLRQRLQRDTNDLDSWRMLGRAELARGRAEEARQAFERAAALAPTDAQAKVDLADATAQAAGSVLEGRPIALIREALAIDPKNPKALALAGAYEVTQRNPQAAIGFWKRLVEVLPADSEQARQVAGFVADLEAGRAPSLARQPEGSTDGRAPGAPAGAGASPPTAAAPPAAGAPSAAGAPPPSGMPPAASTAPPSAAAAAAALRGRVEVERGLAARLRADDTLFVVARTIDDAGKPVGPPIAVMRARGADLPLDFTLDDRMSMSPMARLSALPGDARIVVIARLSRSGEAAARSGDLQGASNAVRPGASGMRVLIDTVVD